MVLELHTMSSTQHSIETVLAARIRNARRSMPLDNGRRVSQQALADRVGVHVITVSQWERGKSAPTVANLMAIADATGQPMEFFTGDSDDDEESERRMRALISLLMERQQYDIAHDLLTQVRLMKIRREERVA